MTAKHAIAVVVPVYRGTLAPREKLVINNIREKLNDYTIIIVKPIGLQLDTYLSSFIITENWQLHEFNHEYFANIRGYNNLLMGIEFYQAFQEKGIKYILIHQLDAYVFSDQLFMWVNKGYDYIGAPWLNHKYYDNLTGGKKKIIWKSLSFVTRIVQSKTDWLVGNGGFSLRNIDKSIFILRLYRNFTAKQDINEDMFWSIYAPLLNPFFKVPNMSQAVGFAFEQQPKAFFKLNSNQLPFGCHAWEKYDAEFWKSWIKIDETIN